MIDLSPWLLYAMIEASDIHPVARPNSRKVERVLTTQEETDLPQDVAWPPLSHCEISSKVPTDLATDFSMSSELVVIEEARKVIMALSGIPINEEDDMIFSQILDKRLAARKRTLL